MGMAYIEPEKAPYLLPNGLVRCEPCNATWNPKSHFVRGFRGRPDTTPRDNFTKVADVPKGECPWCRTKITPPTN